MPFSAAYFSPWLILRHAVDISYATATPAYNIAAIFAILLHYMPPFILMPPLPLRLAIHADAIDAIIFADDSYASHYYAADAAIATPFHYCFRHYAIISRCHSAFAIFAPLPHEAITPLFHADIVIVFIISPYAISAAAFFITIITPLSSPLTG
jgi:hypothetical protein